MKTKINKITEEYIEFDNGLKLLSVHDTDCCESHYLDFKDTRCKNKNNENT